MDKMLKGKITISKPQNSMRRDYISISVMCETSHCEAIDIEMDLKDFADAITGMGYINCQFDLNQSGIIGKKREYKVVPLTFSELPYKKEDVQPLIEAQVSHEETDGWTRDNYSIYDSRHKWINNWDKKTTTINVGFVRYV